MRNWNFAVTSRPVPGLRLAGTGLRQRRVGPLDGTSSCLGTRVSRCVKRDSWMSLRNRGGIIFRVPSTCVTAGNTVAAYRLQQIQLLAFRESATVSALERDGETDVSDKSGLRRQTKSHVSLSSASYCSAACSSQASQALYQESAIGIRRTDQAQWA